jgi:hypothetical protein
MPTKKDPRDKTGTIIHAIADRVLSDHTAKNIYGNVNYCKYFMQGTVVDVFNGRVPGRKNAIWKLTVDFEMPSDESWLELKRFVVNRRHCTHGPVPAGKNPQCSVTLTDLIGDPEHAVKGSTTYLPNAEGRGAAASAVTAATTTDDGDDNDVAAVASRVSLSPAPVDNKIEVILLPPTPPPPPVGKTATKKKRKKAAAPDDASTATPQSKKSKATKKKKAAKPVDLRASPMWVSMTDLKKHRVVAIAHEQKWVVGNADTITGDFTDEPSSNHQWSHKGPFGERIAPGNPEYMDMSPLKAFLHMMPPAQLALVLELTNARLAAKEKREMTRQELLRWIGVCMLIASINFRGDCRKLWEGGGATSKYLPSYDLRGMGMSRNRFDDIWYAVRWSQQPPNQPDGMSSERYRWMLVDDFIDNINEYRSRTFDPGDHVEADETVIRWYGVGGAFVDAGLPMYLAL